MPSNGACASFGFVQPVLARREDRTVIGGHQPLVAAPSPRAGRRPGRLARHLGRSGAASRARLQQDTRRRMSRPRSPRVIAVTPVETAARPNDRLISRELPYSTLPLRAQPHQGRGSGWSNRHDRSIVCTGATRQRCRAAMRWVIGRLRLARFGLPMRLPMRTGRRARRLDFEDPIRNWCRSSSPCPRHNRRRHQPARIASSRARR